MGARAFGFLLGGMLLCGVTALAQQPEEAPQQHDTETLHVHARIVVLDVVVTDKHGRLTDRQLTRDDFTILEDGKPQRIAGFEPPSTHRMPASDAAIVNSAADLKKIGDAPVTILVLDELNSRFEDMSYARQMMVRYLQAQPAVLKQPTSLVAVENTKFEQLHDYTQDRAALIQAVNKHVAEYPWRMEGSHNSGAGAVERMAQSLSVLQAIAQSSTGTPGRKNVIWVGNGFPTADFVGLSSDQAATIEKAMRRTVNHLLAARVTMYTVNPQAGQTATVEADTVDDLTAGDDNVGSDPFGGGSVNFSQLAPDTGGIAYRGRNDIETVISEGIAKGQDYYTIAYTPANDSEQAAPFRKIRILMKDKDLRATTRDGYYADPQADLNPVLDKTMSAKQVRANLQMDLSSALTTMLAYNGLAVTAAPMGNGMYAIRVAGNGIEWSAMDTDGKAHEEATVAAAWYDSKGKIIGHIAREQTSSRNANGGATYVLPITVPPTASRLRILVRDALNGHMGTVDITKFQAAR